MSLKGSEAYIAAIMELTQVAVRSGLASQEFSAMLEHSVEMPDIQWPIILEPIPLEFIVPLWLMKAIGFRRDVRRRVWVHWFFGPITDQALLTRWI